MKKIYYPLILICAALFSLSSVAGDDRQAIHASAEDVQPLMPGMKAPDFSVRDATGMSFEYKADAMEKPVVLTFYRGGWCPYCNLHLAEMRETEAQLKDMGFDIWFISMDKPELLLESLDDPNIGYTIYSDSSLSATRAFGLAFQMPDEMVEKYKTYNIDLEMASGETHHVLPAPATYLIGADGIINFGYVNPDYKVRLAPSVLLAAAEAYKDGVDRRLSEARKKASEK
jgi:peroxiredoxin